MPDGEHMEHGVPVQRNAVVEYKREHELVLLVMNVEVLVQDPPLNQDIAVLHTVCFRLTISFNFIQGNESLIQTGTPMSQPIIHNTLLEF